MGLSKHIAEARKAAGLTQTGAARCLGIRPQSVQAWESGVSAPRARRLTELAQILEVPEAFFFGSSDQEGISPTMDFPQSYGKRVTWAKKSLRWPVRNSLTDGRLISSES